MGIRNSMKIIFSILAITVIFANVSQAINSNAGTAAYPFLKIGTGAKSQGLGGAFVGLADDETALYYNPAGITAKGVWTQVFDEILNKPLNVAPKNRVAASYINYLLNFQYGFVGYIRDIDETTSGGVSVVYQNYGTFNRLDSSGVQLGTFGASDLAFNLTYSKRIKPRISVGATGKIIYENIDSYSSSGLAIDLGFMYLVNDEGTTRFGLALTNFGAQLKGLTSTHKDNLPTKFAAGLSSRLKGLPLLFSGEIGKPFDNDFYLAIGAQVVSLDPFFLRVGWTTAGKDYKTGGKRDYLGGFSGGFGYAYRNYKVDYAYSSYGDLGSVHRISFAAGF